MNAVRKIIDPVTLSRMIGQPHQPTPAQADVIGAPPEPLLVVAGAGAGKTETMAARVVWLVANGFVRPEEVLGLTFTRKAARELGQRIRERLASLAASRAFDAVASPQVREALQVITPEVSTYDAYAGSLVREYGLLLPAEPGAEVLDGATQWQMAWELVRDRGSIATDLGVADLVGKLMTLSEEIDSNLASVDEVREQTEAFIANVMQTPKAPRQRKDLHSKLEGPLRAQRDRLAMLPLVGELRRRHEDAGAVTFGRQMAMAARLADGIGEVGESERARFRVVMLDEYQDTSHAQRVLLRALFAGTAVTAVGDPMQAIYEWRGATAANLTRFVTDFPRPDGRPAEKKQLLTSWRNPSAVLELANDVSSRAFGDGPRTVEELAPRAGAECGTVRLALHSTADDELTWVAEHMAEEFRAAREEGRSITAAVLVRKNKHSAAILDALTAAGVPAEIVGLAGLLTLPEILDVIACLRVLADPADDRAMLRILTWPRAPLGAADIKALGRRARQLARYAGETVVEAEVDGPLSALDADLAEIAAQRVTPPTGLGHAVADPALDDEGDAAPGYSDEGRRRIADLSAKLRNLRRFSLRKPLPELIADVEEAFGIRVEAAVSEVGTVHLDRFTEVAADFSRRLGGELPAFLGYLERAAVHDKGLEPGKTRMRGDRVEIMTVHKAKGLEWNVVAMPHVCASVYDEVQVDTWLTKAQLLPSDVVGEDEAGRGESGDGAPVLDTSGAENQSELAAALEEHKAQYRTAKIAEADRLFYVAVTRAEDVLLVSGSQRMTPGRKKPDGPSEHLTALRALRPDAVETWVDEVSAEPLPIPDAEGVRWPAAPDPARREVLERAAGLVRSFSDPDSPDAVSAPDSSRPVPGDLSQVWEDEVSMLLEERRRARAEAVSVPMPVQLSTSEYQALRADPEAFARRRARPVPYKPNRFARRGTAFHAWLENRFGTSALLDDDDLFAVVDEDGEMVDADVEKLKARFSASQWADRTPEFVEEPFDIGVGGRRIVGRIDAVFRIDGTWMVVDWKTGRRPVGEKARQAALQLAVYRIAWADRRRAAGEDIDPGDVRAAFHYIVDDVTVEPAGKDLPDRLELDEAMRELVADTTTRKGG
ncbi:ATP-dependent DNA helicase [Corynebacterium freneyi]|uniref:ATP-dependent helicase n=1 Tax=Corynebacterium freneyi TaxID=134034 RepID=UPI00254A8367|nr:ATP-dependent DNA helicase [Corynebacterium freneyi]MDK8768312.1 ATP-dependent DNA helicase [Corynebacterium freneyi]